MIRFKLISKKNSGNSSKLTYKFSALGLEGSLIIDVATLDITLHDLEGYYVDDKKEQESIMFTARRTLKDRNFPDRCIYACC